MTSTPRPDAAPVPGGPRVAVKAIIVDRARVLLNRYREHDGREVLALPGGGQERGESQAEALRRECREEIGADVAVHDLACVYETIERVDGTLRFHQVNLAYWAGLAPGEEPGLGSAPDSRQVGVAWVPIRELHEHDVRPPELTDWLLSDPGARPTGLGVTGA
ncbi:NUDIX domain-containing protein [Brachybacterium sp. EF45031]|uniref:NUDIX domain-containing protein n=1 Tax=Brachybacterium sillae TaxID=2810536 RepID=UPI00217EE9D4|nr:NUDIX domain-containing protein [Brachybacterium sillae]MCS6711706.1 NUDIX domain-containing protein [Brachybacterium sillae]